MRARTSRARPSAGLLPPPTVGGRGVPSAKRSRGDVGKSPDTEWALIPSAFALARDIAGVVLGVGAAFGVDGVFGVVGAAPAIDVARFGSGLVLVFDAAAAAARAALATVGAVVRSSSALLLVGVAFAVEAGDVLRGAEGERGAAAAGLGLALGVFDGDRLRADGDASAPAPAAMYSALI
eukprot:Opistho-1_new@97354